MFLIPALSCDVVSQPSAGVSDRRTNAPKIKPKWPPPRTPKEKRDRGERAEEERVRRWNQEVVRTRLERVRKKGIPCKYGFQM